MRRDNKRKMFIFVQQVSPTELESILIEIPGISDCAVVGTPDDVAGEVPRAFVVKRTNSDLTEEAIKKQVESKVERKRERERILSTIKRIAKGIVDHYEFIFCRLLLTRNSTGV